MVNSLLEKKHSIIIINVGASGFFKKQKIYNIDLPSSGIIKYFIFFIKTKKIIAKICPNFIIASDLYSLPSACSLRKGLVVFDSREIYSHLAALKNKTYKQRFWALVESVFIKKVHHVFVTAKTDKQFLLNRYGNLKISILKNFPSIKIKSNDKNKLRDFLEIERKRKIFLYQGVLQKGRGIKNMIKLLTYFDNADGVIIGSGFYKNELSRYIHKNNLSNRVYFINTVPYIDLLQYTSGADIGFALIKPISKSYINALPNKIFEYVLSDIPVLASNLPEIKAVFDNYDIGYCVDSSNINFQIELIKKILNNNYSNLQNTALNNFVWETQTHKFLNVFNIS